MHSRFDREKVKVLIERSGLNDRELGDLIGSAQSTIWRLRNGRIAKVNKYIVKIEGALHLPAVAASASGVEELVELSRQSPALRSLLEGVLQLMQEDASAFADR
jgi:transcriptional regulator with XRE-family HTH domain